jgi:hypothetical protein
MKDRETCELRAHLSLGSELCDVREWNIIKYITNRLHQFGMLTPSSKIKSFWARPLKMGAVCFRGVCNELSSGAVQYLRRPKTSSTWQRKSHIASVHSEAWLSPHHVAAYGGYSTNS